MGKRERGTGNRQQATGNGQIRNPTRESLLVIGVFIWLVLVITVFMSQPYVAQVINVLVQLLAPGSGQ